jgi:hypothetical protein
MQPSTDATRIDNVSLMRFMGILLLVVNFASTPSWPSQRVVGLTDFCCWVQRTDIHVRCRWV